MFALGGQRIQPAQDGGRCVLSRPGGVVELVGGKVAQVFQQCRAPGGQTHRVQMQGALHGFKLLGGPHFAVFFHPGGAFGVPYLHGGKIIARERGFQHKAFRIFAFAAGGTADHQRQHWGVYGVMPPSVKE